jgi:ABC-type amino acid transport substrate-binding protein/mono/diheme cytochrome c family protein
MLARAAGAEEAPSFRLCADPDNLPFSATSRETPGFYIEFGRAIAARLGRAFEPVWEPTYFARRAVRTSLLKGRCDGFIGLPDEADFMGPKIIFSKPVLALGYALVLPRQGMAVKGLSDLAGRRVAVQFASPPQNLLATRDDVEIVTALSPEEAMRDLAEGRADAAFIWGPSAGWIDKSMLGGAYAVVPVAGPHMQWRASIGFPSGDAALRDQVDAAIEALAAFADELKAKYGFPNAPPISLAQTGEAPLGRAPGEPAKKAEDAASPSSQMVAIAPEPSPPTTTSMADADAAKGHQLFNENCSHCHGPDAVQGERRRNLRLLHHRYGEEFDRVFMTTVTQGRVAKGMPNWSGILTDAQFEKILAYLHSVQEP